MTRVIITACQDGRQQNKHCDDIIIGASTTGYSTYAICCRYGWMCKPWSICPAQSSLIAGFISKVQGADIFSKCWDSSIFGDSPII